MERLLTFNDILEIMGWKKTKGYEMCQRKDFPAFKDGKQWKVQESKLQQWIELKSSPTNTPTKKYISIR